MPAFRSLRPQFLAATLALTAAFVGVAHAADTPSAKPGAVRLPSRGVVSQRNGIGVAPGVLEAVPLHIG